MSSRPSMECLSTGEAELDRLLGGGLPAHSVTIVSGEPGTGKTILVLQMLFSAARRGVKSLYFSTLSEPAVKVIGHMHQFTFFDPQQVDRTFFLFDLGSALEQGPDQALAEVRARIEAVEPTIVVIDSFRAAGELVGQRRRTFVYQLANELTALGATAILVGEYAPHEYTQLPEFAVADGILALSFKHEEFTTIRALEVLKLRGAAPILGTHFFEISGTGLQVFPRVRAPSATEGMSHPALTERASTGVTGLDRLLGGGLPRTSTTVLEGSPGTGKTILGMQFLIAGARQGERGILFTLEETPAQLRAVAESLGWNLRELEAAGLLAIQYTSPVELWTDRYLYEARRQVTEFGAQRALFDGLTTMKLGVPSERRFKELVYAIAKHLSLAGVTQLWTMEVEQLLGRTLLSGFGISFLADDLIQLRYADLDGRLGRVLSVLKMRGVHHSTALHQLEIGQGGCRIAQRAFRARHPAPDTAPSLDPHPEGNG